jgi:hypothetical protein
MVAGKIQSCPNAIKRLLEMQHATKKNIYSNFPSP